MMFAGTELEEAERILEAQLIFSQTKKSMNRTDRNLTQDLLDQRIEHFLRREEPESLYFDQFHKSTEVTGQIPLPPTE